jgi:type IV pilus assembly protein PilC
VRRERSIIDIARRKEMTPAQLSAFFSSLKLVYRSGIALDSGLEILQSNTESAEERERIKALRAAASDGAPLHEALARMGGVPEYALSLAAIAVETGRMDATMESLQIYYEKRDALNQSIRSAVVYPLSMMCMVFLVVVVLLTQAMPVFQQVFAQLGFRMTGLAGGLLDLGDAISRYALGICAVLLLILAAAVLLRVTPGGRKILKRLFDSSFLTKKLSLRMSVQKFALSMSTMLSCGVGWDMALQLAKPLLGNQKAEDRVALIQRTMQEGGSFQSALEASGLFPGNAMALLAMGIQTGTDADAFELIGETLSAETESRVERLVAAIEPAMVCVMCILVGMVLLSVMLPIMGVLTSM